ncbi:hypothetical protein CW304_17385 [Bacillus sp. UFRGS-B20]|nr:hypothetical protein CW304_17385 [Bacillus sp. UFRGS-B20]
MIFPVPLLFSSGSVICPPFPLLGAEVSSTFRMSFPFRPPGFLPVPLVCFVPPPGFPQVSVVCLRSSLLGFLQFRLSVSRSAPVFPPTFLVLFPPFRLGVSSSRCLFPFRPPGFLRFRSVPFRSWVSSSSVICFRSASWVSSSSLSFPFRLLGFPSVPLLSLFRLLGSYFAWCVFSICF